MLVCGEKGNFKIYSIKEIKVLYNRYNRGFIMFSFINKFK